MITEKAIMDFTLKTYRSLLSALRRAGYTFRTFEEFLSVPADGKVVILRHDIDKRPENALRLAQIEHASGVKASYYIRVVKGTWNEDLPCGHRSYNSIVPESRTNEHGGQNYYKYDETYSG